MKLFYKDIRVIKSCKICGIEYRLQKYEKDKSYGLCYVHRPLRWKILYEKYGKYVDWTKYKAGRKKVWNAWVARNPERRRAQARASYHRRKHLKRPRPA